MEPNAAKEPTAAAAAPDAPQPPAARGPAAVTPAETSRSLSVNMRCLRKRMGISQEDLARRVGLNRGNIASYEKGTAEPKLCNLLKLSHLFGVSIHDLTRRDLGCDAAYRKAYTNYLRLNSEEAAALNDFDAEAQELRAVFEGITRCYDFLVRKGTELDPQARMLDGQFTQMRHLTEETLRAHRELLEFVQCRLKE